MSVRKLAIVAGESSGDTLGAKLMAALRAERRDIAFVGVGGAAMAGQGLVSFFPLDDIHVMGVSAVLARLPLILRRIRETAERIIAERPDGLIIIDAPDFTHRVAKRVRKALPQLKVVDYVSPSVWAWRPGRAPAMRGYVDRVLALLPFEPAAHRRLGGPDCSYVGHPLIERLGELRPGVAEAARREAKPPLVLVLPGSRRSEIARLMAPFGEALALLAARVGPFELALPTLPHVEALVRSHAARWPVQPHIVLGEAEKFALFRSARAALAASGTVTLELALAGVPHVGAYRVSGLELLVRPFVSTSSFLLPNLVLGERAIPELMQEECTPATLAAAMAPLIGEGPERAAQLTALARLDALMALPGGEAPSAAAARAVMEVLGW